LTWVALTDGKIDVSADPAKSAATHFVNWDGSGHVDNKPEFFQIRSATGTSTKVYGDYCVAKAMYHERPVAPLSTSIKQDGYNKAQITV
jgi:hypothetical protein